MSAVRPVREAENRLRGWSREVPAILAEVERRVVDARVQAAAKGGDASLEYVLNDAAYHEIRRLEHGLATPTEKKRLPEWRDLARRLGGMSGEDKRRRLEALVREYVRDVAGNFDDRVYRFARGLGPRLLTGLLSPQSLQGGFSGLSDLSRRIQVDGPLDHLHACADRGTFIVTPTHVSNMDSPVIGYSLEQAGLPPCTYGAGKNLWSNPFLGFFMRNLGAYRVDRRLKHALYLHVLKEYSTVILAHGYHSIFFPGGTRSRSGGVERKLKLGLLGTGLAAYQQNLRAGAPHRRVYVVPVSINYGITLEAETLIDDHLADEGKHRYIIDDDEFSRLGRIIEFTRKILNMEGACLIRYGTPLDPFGNPVDGEGESIDPYGRRIDPASYVLGADGQVAADAQRDAEYTRGLGEELARAYQRLTLYLPTHLCARALFDHVAAREKTGDVYRLLRLTGGFEVAIETLRADVDRLRRDVAARPEAGALPARVAAMRPGDVVDEALRAFKGYHTRPVAERVGEQVVVRHMRLLFYYRNRTAHFQREP